MKFTLILPAFNEEDRLPGTLQNLAEFVWPSWVEPEVLVVLDGCTDDTKEIADSFLGKISGLRVLDWRLNEGKGHAVKLGVFEAKGDWVAFTDSDESYPFAHHLPLLLEETKSGAPIIIGSRQHPDSVSDEVHPPLLRKFMSRFYSFLCQVLLIPGVKDAQAGLKMFRNDIARDLFSRTQIHRFGFDTEILYLSRKLGIPFKEIPVSVRHVPESRVHPIRDSLDMISNLITIRFLHREVKGLGSMLISPRAETFINLDSKKVG